MRVLLRLLPSLLVLLAVANGSLLLLLLRAVATALLRLAHVAVLLSGSGVVWWSLRKYQLAVEHEIYDTALLKHRFYERYRAKDAPGLGFQLKVVKRLPVATHLRTAWGLAPEIADEIAEFVRLAVRDYVSYWFAPVSPNDDFPHDVKFLLADMFGAVVARVLEIDSTLALTMTAKCVELLRLHLGWFREAYAQLAEEHPSVFQGEESDANLQRRQELIAAYVQSAKFLHPGCVATPAGKKPSAGDAADVQYLRHVATQLLVQLKPELGQQSGTNLFVSIAMNFMREALLFKALKPISEYSQPRYANEVVVTALLAETGVESVGSPVTSPTAAGAATPTSGANASGLGFNVPLPQLNSPSIDLKSLRMTTSFLYKASKRSSEQAEAALHAVFDAVSSAASTASSSMGSLSSLGSVTSPTANDLVFEADYWSDSAGFGVVSPRSPTAMPLSPPMNPMPAPTPTAERKGGHFASLFSLEDRITFPKTPRMPPRVPANTGFSKSIISSAGLAPDTPGSSSTHMEDLKNMKANLESSLNSSLFKVKKTFRNIGGHIQDQSQLAVTSTTTQAANLIKKPGKLFQIALRRSDTTSSETPAPVSPVDFPSTPPPLCSSFSGEYEGEKTLLRSPTQAQSPATPNSPSSREIHTQERVLLLLEKTTANYVKLYQERVEMRNSARSRELYELLSALEDVFMLGYRKPSGDIDEANGADTPPGSPSQRGSISSQSADDLLVTGKTPPSSPSKPCLLDPGQVYWNYLAQDRPEAPFLNEHWRFIETSCPVCADSESFYSTRGIQWILIALEKGMLWEYFTALHLNRRLTELFYEDIAVLRNGKLMEKVLKTLFQLNKVQLSLEIPHVLGRQSELEKELGITRALVSASSQLVRVVETAWEVQRYVPIHGWVKSQDKRSKDLPSSEWIWENEWTLESMGDARTPIAPRRSTSAGSDSSDVESATWEYGKSLDDRFHDKEKKLDSVRRRKWTRRRRQLPPVLSLPSQTGRANLSVPRSSNVGAVGKPVSSPPELELQSSPRRHMSRQGSWDADDVELANRKKNPAMTPKRRSFSFDKGAGSIEDPPSPPPQPRTSGSRVGGVFRRKKRTFSASASIKRVGSAQKQEGTNGKSKKAEGMMSDDDLVGVGATLIAGGDADDDSGLCFRCLKALDSQPSRSDSCQSCHQRVCASCHSFYAFLVYPPLESSMKEQVCGSCYDRLVGRYKLRVEAHVGKYLIKENERDACDVESAVEGFSNPGGNGVVNTPPESESGHPAPRSGYRYEVTVQVRDESAYGWSVVKTFSDFEQLEKQLHEKLKKQEKKHGTASSMGHWRGVDYSELRKVEPSLKQFKSTVANPTYEKKLFVLETFLQRLVQSDTLCQSSAVQKFLLLGENMSSISSAGRLSDQSEASMSGENGNGSTLHTTTAVGNGAPSGVGANATVMVENGKWRRGKWIAPEANSKETKMRVLQKLEVSLFAVLSEVFEFDGIGILRRQLFSMSRSFIKAFLSASHFRKIERQYLTFTDPKKMAGHVASFREYMFPEEPIEPPPPETLSAAEMQALRKKSLEAILSSLPSTIVSVFGEASSANAALKLHEFLQHEVFLKNLLFSMCDELLPHVFPDIVPYTPKAKATQKQ